MWKAILFNRDSLISIMPMIHFPSLKTVPIGYENISIYLDDLFQLEIIKRSKATTINSDYQCNPARQ